MNDQELMLQFESLGEDCEFSFIQRRARAEPLEMLRFTGTTLGELLIGFASKFAAIGDPEHTFIKVTLNKEVWCVNRKHRFEAHVFRHPDELDIPAFEAEQCRRLKLLRRKFFEDLEEGRKILVYKRRTPITCDEVRPLHDWIRRYGPATLLWVVVQDEHRKPGTVEQLAPGFLKGYIDTFTPYGRAAYGSLDVWLEIARNAYPLRQNPASAKVA
jgi:hypothetical protein